MLGRHKRAPRRSAGKAYSLREQTFLGIARIFRELLSKEFNGSVDDKFVIRRIQVRWEHGRGCSFSTLVIHPHARFAIYTFSSFLLGSTNLRCIHHANSLRDIIFLRFLLTHSFFFLFTFIHIHRDIRISCRRESLPSSFAGSFVVLKSCTVCVRIQSMVVDGSLDARHTSRVFSSLSLSLFY